MLLHVHLLAPLVIATFIYAAREEAQRAEEVDVAFENVSAEELPSDLPPLDDTPEPLADAAPDRSDRDRDKPKPKPKDQAVEKPEEKVAEEKPPEPEVVVPPQPPMPEPKPKTQTKSHEKIVDLDNDKEVEPPPDAKYLAQKNNRAEVETRDTRTNMDRDQKGDDGSQQPEGERKDDAEAGDDKEKIADLEQQESKLGRAAPEVTPRRENEAPAQNQQERTERQSPVLSLRDPSPRGHEVTPETVDPSLPHDPAGMLARAKPKGSFRDNEARNQAQGGKQLKLSLSGKDYEYLFGAEAKAERQLAQREQSSQVGKHTKRLDRVRSSLQNFIPEVTPGNRTALNTRAAPFAAFIARMHRNIHRLWGFGALEDWDELPSTSPFNDDSLASTLEIVLNRDGTVDKVTVVKASRYLPYDAAAIDTVYTAGPYPEPPRDIRSRNGKIYMHWTFHRDARQCATGWVDYFILNNPPKGGDLGVDDDAASEPAGDGAPPAGPRRLERNLGEGPRGTPASRAAIPAHEHSEHEHPGAEESQPAGGQGAERAAAGGSPRSGDGAAASVAREWFAAFARGDITAMNRRARFPFRSGAGVAAKSPDELGRMLRSLVAESPRRAMGEVRVETAAGLRKMIGKLPPGLDDGSGMLYAVTEVDGDTLILPLVATPQGWKAAGLIRR